MEDLTALEKARLESAAYRHWLGVMMVLQASGKVFTPAVMKDHLSQLEIKNHPNLAMIHQVSVEITERTFAYIETQDIDQLWLDQ
ncbi:hypothetical protein [Agrobacterium pusense]|uniref:Uncharacterized protein n=1 Tax=Agrobacterium pusense TaxID=648995 RepID=A0AA44J1X3_9HYPH|nr:hypothetical protein [Agrobacterium pusense]NRF12277.1 hypothetical protein [Agrobacterium pusense]NRF22987.1 hypothetical protein [Agrobacterium pusense]